MLYSYLYCCYNLIKLVKDWFSKQFLTKRTYFHNSYKHLVLQTAKNNVKIINNNYTSFLFFLKEKHLRNLPSLISLNYSLKYFYIILN